MKKMTFYLAAFTIVFSTLSFGSPVTDYTFVREFGQSGIESNRFWQINGIAVDRFGHVFVSDLFPIDITPNGTNSDLVIKRWSTVGQYELLWQAHNSVETPMRWPAGIDCSCDGDPFYVAPLYIMWPYGKAIEHTSPEGAFFEIFPEDLWNIDGFYFIDVAISADGYAFGTFYKNLLPGTGAAGLKPGVAKFYWEGTKWIPVAEILLTNLSDETSSDVHAIDVDPWRDKVYVTVLSRHVSLAARS